MIKRTIEYTLVKIAVLTVSDGAAGIENADIILKGKNLSIRTIKNRIKRQGYTDFTIVSVENKTETLKMPIEFFIKNAIKVNSDEIDITYENDIEDIDIMEN